MIVVAKVKAKPGCEGEMETALTEMVAKVEKETGTLAYTLHRSHKDPSVFMFYEKYADAAAFAAHGATPYFKTLVEAILPLLDGDLEMETYNEVVGLKR
jgi:quinol monooxygenase YgiN